jgi:peptidoglycan/LPS O-acetylase OafA/YrhL
MRNASLEGVRGAAALLVVFYHVGFAAVPIIGNGYLAVDLFFVLSGFVIGGAYGGLSSGAQVGAFVVRRFGRLWPVHIASNVVLFGSVVMVAAWARAPHLAANLPSPADAAVISLFAQGAMPHAIGVPVEWSTSDEFYAYVLFGLVCLLTRRGKARVAALAGLAALAYGAALWISVGPSECLYRGHCLDVTYGLGFARCAAGFFGGALIAEYRNTRPVHALSRRGPQAFIALGALAFVNAACLPGVALAAPLVFAALVASLSNDSGPVARIFRADSAQYLGRMSYSLYLAHGACLPAFALATDLTGNYAARVAENVLFFAASFALAHVLNRYVETPCRRRINAWADAAFRPIASEPEASAHFPRRTLA